MFKDIRCFINEIKTTLYATNSRRVPAKIKLTYLHQLVHPQTDRNHSRLAGPHNFGESRRSYFLRKYHRNSQNLSCRIDLSSLWIDVAIRARGGDEDVYIVER